MTAEARNKTKRGKEIILEPFGREHWAFGATRSGPERSVTTQNASRNANCITRGSPESDVILATPPLVIFPFGWPNSGVFVTLNTSQSASMLKFS